MRGFHVGYLDLAGRHPARYQRLRARFDEVVQDFHYAASHCRITTERVGIETDDDGTTLYYDAHIYTFEPPGLWEDLAPKWGLRSMMGFGRFSSLLESYMNLLCPRYPYPKFQQLKLLDLPAELLNRIMCLSDLEDLQKWSVVCKLLRELALVYVYKDYDYDLKAYMLDHDFIETIPKDENYQDRFDEYLQSFALEQRDELAGRMRRVLQRRDILSSIRRLGFNESWSMSNLLPSIGFTYAEYVAPVMPLLAGHICSSSLSKLHFMALYLYRSVWEAMAGSRSLHTATLYTAKAAEDEGAQWQVPSLAPSLINLELRMIHEVDENHLWDLVCLCPSLLYLNLSGLPQFGSPLPGHVFAPYPGNVTTYLRRLSLENIWAGTLDDLIAAIYAAPMVPLTHLSISTTQSHIKRDLAFRLIRSFARVPDLRLLAISNLQYARPDLFALLAECAPAVETLALQHYPSIWHRKSGSSLWPCPTYEYAPALAAFPRLKYLALNMKIVDCTYTPFFLPRAEISFDDVEAAEKEAARLWFSEGANPDDHPEYVDFCLGEPVGTVARLFATHSRTLRMVVLDHLAMSGSWAIDRDGHGKASVRNKLTGEEQWRAYSSGFPLVAYRWAFEEWEANEILADRRCFPLFIYE
ncbi:hypothetical protein EV714DRAFT_268386 [Schizophyllum commune]